MSSERPVWIGTSWKMNKTLAEAEAFIERITAVPCAEGVQPFVLPAHTALATARDRIPAGSALMLGAQNAHWASEGAWTGEISMRMAADAGAKLIEMGHSERRQHFGETDGTVAAKAAAAVDHGLVPLICVGEPGEVRAAGETEAFVGTQVRTALSLLSPDGVGRAIVAYEPVWAIGEHGRPATPAEVAPVMRCIADTVAEAAGGESLRALLYGGGVNLENAADLLRDPCTDGLFVGRAGWESEGFLALMRTAATSRAA